MSAILLGVSLALLTPLVAQAALNAATFRRLPPVPVGGPAPRIAVLVPARDEATRIGPLLESFIALPAHEAAELVVYDDASEDGTAEVVRAAMARDPRIRLVTGQGPPAGWGGKVHALHRLAQAAAPDADLLLFVDADVTLEPGGLPRAAAALAADGLDVLSLYPAQTLGTWAERAFVPMMVYYFYLLAPQWLHARGAKVLVAPLNGQFMLWRRDRLTAIGGWEAIRGAWLDDMEMGRRVAAEGFRARYRAGAGVARCRMYTGFGEVWRGFAKHAFDCTGISPAAFIGLQAWLAIALVAPWLALLCWLFHVPGPAELAAFTVIALLTAGTRVVAAVQTGHGWTSALLHPLTMALAILNGLWSLWLATRATSAWKGRIRGGITSAQPPSSPPAPAPQAAPSRPPAD